MAARRLHLDIETYRTRNEALLTAISFEAANAKPAQNTAKDLKDVWDTQDAIEKRIDAAIAKTSCNPMYAEILTICVKTENADVLVIDAMEQREENALIELEQFISDVADKDTVWTGFNVKGFDYPIILNRMIRHCIRPPEHFPKYNGRSWHGRIYDTMERLPSPVPFACNFSTACQIYGLPCKTIEIEDGITMSGSMVGQAFETGWYQIIRDYCADDVINEERLYLAMTHGDAWGTYETGGDADLEFLKSLLEDNETSNAHKWIAAQSSIKALTKSLG